jgi:hypothetical protein
MVPADGSRECPAAVHRFFARNDAIVCFVSAAPHRLSRASLGAPLKRSACEAELGEIVAKVARPGGRLLIVAVAFEELKVCQIEPGGNARHLPCREALDARCPAHGRPKGK